MTLRFFGLLDGRRLQALRAIRKLLALGFTASDVSTLLRDYRKERRRSTVEPADRDGRRDKIVRLRMAQGAIRTLLALGYAETEIARLVGVDHSTITHLLASDGSRSVSWETVAAFRDAVTRAGAVRLQLLLRRLEIHVLDTCCDKGRALNLSSGGSSTESVRRLVMNSLVHPAEPAPLESGLQAFLAQVGGPASRVFVFGTTSHAGENDHDARIQELRALEHEVQHILERFRSERIRLEVERKKHCEIPGSGRIA